MAEFQEYALADYTRALTESGIDLVINGETVRCFCPPEETVRSEFERVLLVHKKIYHLAGAIDLFIPGQVITIGSVDAVRWLVVGHVVHAFSVCLTLERSMG